MVPETEKNIPEEDVENVDDSSENQNSYASSQKRGQSVGTNSSEVSSKQEENEQYFPSNKALVKNKMEEIVEDEKEAEDESNHSSIFENKK